MPMTNDTCNGCGAKRRKRARWFFVYPDIVGKAVLVPIAVFCPPCAAQHGIPPRKGRPQP
jgi:hypothetical protein